MSEGQRRLQQVRLKDFRCFGAEQTARLAPLTLLVGDNGTGKTSFLAAVRAICEVAFLQREPDFRKPPFDLGTFPQIVHDRGLPKNRSETFGIGVRAFDSVHGVLGCEVTFKSGLAAAPSLSKGRATLGEKWIEWREAEEQGVTLEFGSNGRSRHTATLKNADPCNWTWMGSRACSLLKMGHHVTGEASEGQESLALTDLVLAFEMLNPEWFFFAGAPVRSAPLRTYDPSRPSNDPQGTDIPTYLASMQFRSAPRWTTLKESMEAFGRTSGLFDEFSVRQFGRLEGAPFQLEVRKFGRKRKGSKRNLVDAGYGVSQVLPILVQIVRPGGPSLFLLQQPEVHLHPSGQAALGSLFCAKGASGKQVIVETHSDYIMDRVRMDVRDGATNLKAEDVSILFFERSDLDVRIHSLRFDDDGNILDAPDGYGRFFMNEMRRSIGL